MPTRKICLTIDEELLKQIDKKRGLIPRATYINDKIMRVETEAEK